MRDYMQYWVVEDEAIQAVTAQECVEHRMAERYAVNGAALFEAVDAETAPRGSLQAELLDISIQGLGVVSDVPVAQGSRWRVLFSDGARRLGEYFLTVRHCRERNDGRFHVGCQFGVSPGLFERLAGEPAMMPA